ncbi:hypothetical protein QVD17_29210 [Tagetes erecta]|uniref:VQ domain-containing protein n=1 Tax=Tagetes erecta TaxID=13708 RepID=A0AAD8NT94_TARER|nr:hypothetical protein QVD17_29210 [Tagetes erecta]
MKSGVMINGPRPTPLKVKQESHTIQKHHHQQQQQRQQQQQIRKPIIIYMRTPKVIHTKPHEFMALVQKLTGRSCGSKDQKKKRKKTLDERYDLNDNIMESKGPMVNTHVDRYVGDVPLFTPNSSDLFFSPQTFLRLSDVVSSSPSKANASFSPGSLVEFMKGLPEY